MYIHHMPREVTHDAQGMGVWQSVPFLKVGLT